MLFRAFFKTPSRIGHHQGAPFDSNGPTGRICAAETDCTFGLQDLSVQCFSDPLAETVLVCTVLWHAPAIFICCTGNTASFQLPLVRATINVACSMSVQRIAYPVLLAASLNIFDSDAEDFNRLILIHMPSTVCSLNFLSHGHFPH